MKQKPKELDWEKEFEKFLIDELFWEKLVNGSWNDGEYDVTDNREKLKSFISKTLQQQREEIIKEIEGIVGVDTGGTGQVYFYKKQLRKQIRERLKQITNLKEK